jgi:hypothetical protein
MYFRALHRRRSDPGITPLQNLAEIGRLRLQAFDLRASKVQRMTLLSAAIADTPENEELINARHDVVASLAAMSLLGHSRHFGSASRTSGLALCVQPVSATPLVV